MKSKWNLKLMLFLFAIVFIKYYTMLWTTKKLKSLFMLSTVTIVDKLEKIIFERVSDWQDVGMRIKIGLS